MQNKSFYEEIKGASSEVEWLGSAEKYEEDIFEIMTKIKLFENFDRVEISALCRFLECYAVPRNFTLLKEGDRGDYLLLMLNGSVSITKTGPDGSDIALAEEGVGSILGEMAFVDGTTRFASCTTTAPTDFAVVTRESFESILLQMPRLGNKLLIALFQISTTRLRFLYQNLINRGLHQPVSTLI